MSINGNELERLAFDSFFSAISIYRHDVEKLFRLYMDNNTKLLTSDCGKSERVKCRKQINIKAREAEKKCESTTKTSEKGQRFFAQESRIQTFI